MTKHQPLQKALHQACETWADQPDAEPALVDRYRRIAHTLAAIAKHLGLPQDHQDAYQAFAYVMDGDPSPENPLRPALAQILAQAQSPAPDTKAPHPAEPLAKNLPTVQSLDTDTLFAAHELVQSYDFLVAEEGLDPAEACNRLAENQVLPYPEELLAALMVAAPTPAEPRPKPALWPLEADIPR